MSDNKINQLEEVLKLMTKYKVNSVEFEGIKVLKAYHEFPDSTNKKAFPEDNMSDEDMLFMSGS